MTSQTGKQIIALYKFPDISKSQDNQTMKFGQLIEYNMRNIFYKKSHAQNALDKLFPDPFMKNQDWEYLWVDSLKFNTVCFYCMPSQGLQNILKLRC